MASVWILRRKTADDSTRFRVMFRVGGREAPNRYAGSFTTMREARMRRDWVAGELAARRVPDLTTLGDRPVDAITPAHVAELVAELSTKGRKRETIRKTLLAGAMVLDFAGRASDNPFRDKVTVRLPREERAELAPPTAEHVLAVHDVLPHRYKLPLVVLDATGMRLGELERLAWGDVDESRSRWRVSQAVSKTSRARWVNVHPDVFTAVCLLVAREDRTPERRVFQGFGGDRFRTALTRACTAAAVPAFSPHSLRHRRISLLHLSGVPWARIGEQVGQRDLAVTANTYSHVLADEQELEYSDILSSC